MDERTRRAIVRLEVAEDGEVSSRGTGFLVAPELLLTALHVPADRTKIPPRPHTGELRAWFLGESEPRPARLLLEYSDAGDDFALLACTPPPTAKPLPLGILEKSAVVWETHGFPDTTPVDGMGFGGEVRSHFGTYQGARAMQLYSLEAAAGKGAPVHGVSGAPCLVDGVVAGVIRSAILDGKNSIAGTLWACPIASVLERCQAMLRIPDPYWGLPGLPNSALPREPFRYLAPFEEKHAEIFFGRGQEIRDLYQLVTSPTSPQVILVYGQSGVGKSSILAAGLVPRLLATRNVQYRRRLSTRTLLDELRDALAAPVKPEVVIIDQVEEVLTQDGGVHRAQLDELFAQARNIHSGKLVLGFRKEYYAELEKRLEEQDYPRPARRFIERIGRAGVIEAVTGLTRTPRLREAYHLSVDEGVAEKIATQVLADPASPAAATLQIRLTRLWEQATAIKSDAPRFTEALADELERNKLDVRRLFDEQMAKLREPARSAAKKPPKSATDLGLALDILFHHTTELGTAAEHDYQNVLARYGHVRDEAERTIQKLEDLYLLTGAKSEGARRTRLAHDTLAPVVRNAFAQSNAPGQHARRLLETRGLAWRDGAIGALLEDRELTELKKGIDGMRAPTADESRLLEASLREADKARRRRTVQRIFTVVTGIAAIALGVLTWWNQNKQDATAAATAYQSAQVAAEERHDVLAALGLLADAIEKSGSDEERRAVYLSRLLQLAEYAPKAVHQVDVNARQVFFDALATRVLVETTQGELNVWSIGDVTERLATAPSPMPTYAISPTIPAISGNGKVIAAYYGNELLTLELDTRRLTQTKTETPLRCCTLSRDGTRAYGVQRGPQAIQGWLFDTTTGQFIAAPEIINEPGMTDEGMAVTLSCAPPAEVPAASYVALENPAASARCEKEPLGSDNSRGWKIVSSPGGFELSRSPVRSWSFCRPGGCAIMPETTQRFLPPRISAVSGDVLLMISQADELEIFDVPTERWRGQPLRVSEQIGATLALPEQELLIAVRRGLIYRWKTPPKIAGISLTLGTSTAAVGGAAFDPERKVVSFVRDKKLLETYRVEDGQKLWSTALSAVPSNSTALAFDEGGKQLAVAQGNVLSLFDAATGAALWRQPAVAGGRLLAHTFRAPAAGEVVAVWDDFVGLRQVVEVWDVKTGVSKVVACELKRDGFTEVNFAAGGLALELSRAGRLFSGVPLTGPFACRSMGYAGAPLSGAALSGTARTSFVAPNVAASRIADVSASGRWLLTDTRYDGIRRYFRVWDARTGTPLTAPIYRELISAAAIATAALTPDDRELLLVDQSGRLERIRIAVTEAAIPGWLERAIELFALAARNPDYETLQSLPARRREVRAEVENAAAAGDERAVWLKKLFDHTDSTSSAMKTERERENSGPN